VLTVLAATDELSVGVDLVGNVPCDAGFRRLWFTAGEQNWLQHDAEYRTALVWGLKEATYKACNTGEGWMPLAVEMLPQGDGAFRCMYRGELLHGFSSCAWDLDGQVAVLAIVPPQTLTSSATLQPSSNGYKSCASREEAIELCS
jgi:4'-phosphopantetheinyl transferase superfamily